jgi:hypothetical protein
MTCHQRYKQQSCVVTERIVTRIGLQIAGLSKNYERKLNPIVAINREEH